MKQLKFMQNSITSEEWYVGKTALTAKVITTMKRLEVYLGSKLVASVGVANANDFDYNMLLAFAREKSGSKIVA